MNWKEILEKLNTKRAELAEIFAKAKTSVDGQDRYNLTAAQLEDVKARNAEIDDLAKQYEDARAVDEMAQKNDEALRESMRAKSQLPFKAAKAEGQQPEQKSLGRLFTESEAYKQRKSARDIDVRLPEYDHLAAKVLMTTAAGLAPMVVRSGKVVPFAHRRPMIADLIPQTPTEQSAAAYMEETTFTNNAAARLEGGTAGEAALVYTERSWAIREIATWLPVTEIQIEDVGMVESLIDNRLLTMLDLAEEAQLMAGNNVAPQLNGFNTAVTQAQAKGADPTPDAVYKGMTLVRHTGFAEPSAVVFHPNDWQDIRLLRTVDGIYIWGSPAEAGPERIWGLPAVVTTAATENTALLGDFQLYSEIFRRRGANVKVSDSHSTYFIEGKLAIRADKRLALVVYRPNAFCQVTGI